MSLKDVLTTSLFVYGASYTCSYLAGDTKLTEEAAKLMLSPNARAMAASTAAAGAISLVQGAYGLLNKGLIYNGVHLVAIPLIATGLWAAFVGPEVLGLGLDFSSAWKKQAVSALFNPIYEQFVTPVALAVISGVGALVTLKSWNSRRVVGLGAAAACLLSSFVLIFSKASGMADSV